MMGNKQAQYTLYNNITSTHNLVQSVINYCPDCHIIKLGTMGEYGTPNTEIPEGFFDFKYKGRTEKHRLYPRQACSLYHTTKIMDTDLLYFYTRHYNLRVTDLMQAPVYGFLTDETRIHDNLLPNFYYDDIFGTVLNRFLVQAVCNIPLTVYGEGNQVRGFINLTDSLKCIEIATETPAEPGDMRVFNQFTELFSIDNLAEMIKSAGKSIGLSKITTQYRVNPRIEQDKHYYKPHLQKLPDLGFLPEFLTTEILTEYLKRLLPYKDRVKEHSIQPRVIWPGR